MSEQEKMNAVPAEGTITEAKTDERTWLKKFVDTHPKAWKWAKRIGAGLGVTAGLFGAFELGKASGAKAEPETVCIDGATEEDEAEDDAE